MKLNKQQNRPNGMPRASPTPSCYEGSVDDDAVSIRSTYSKHSHFSALSHLLPGGSENAQTAISEISCNTATDQHIDMENLNDDGKVPLYTLNQEGKLSKKYIEVQNQSEVEPQAGYVRPTKSERNGTTKIQQSASSASEFLGNSPGKTRPPSTGAEEGWMATWVSSLNERMDSLFAKNAELQEARDRTLSVRRAVSVLSTRAAELEASLDQAAARKAVGSGPVAGAVEAAPPEDPLLARFKDLEGGK